MRKLLIFPLVLVCACVRAPDPPPATQQQTTVNVPATNSPTFSVDETGTFLQENGRWLFNRQTSRWEYLSNSDYQARFDDYHKRVKRMCEKVMGKKEETELP